MLTETIETQIENAGDVCVLGERSAGIAAAIGATRLGSRATLVNPAGVPGGTLVRGLAILGGREANRSLSMLHDVLGYKNGMRLWIRDYRRRVPHQTDAAYHQNIEHELQNCGELLAALPVEGDERAAPVGVHTGFRVLA